MFACSKRIYFRRETSHSGNDTVYHRSANENECIKNDTEYLGKFFLGYNYLGT